MIAVAGVLALASATRYYLVTIIGERVVADLRAAVFAHLTLLCARLLRQRQDRRDHLAPHRRHDADQERGRLVGFGRAAQYGAVHRLVDHDGGDQPAALPLRDPGDPGDRAAAGGVRPAGAAPFAHRAGHARRRLRLCGRADRRDPHAAGLHQRAAGAIAFRRRGRARIRGGAAIDARARGADRDHHLPGVRAASWSSSGSARRTCSPGAPRRARLGQFILYAVFAASGLGPTERSLGRALAGLRRGRAPDRAARDRAARSRRRRIRSRCPFRRAAR